MLVQRPVTVDLEKYLLLNKEYFLSFFFFFFGLSEDLGKKSEVAMFLAASVFLLPRFVSMEV